MIVRITGILQQVAAQAAWVDVGQGLTYEVLVSSYDETRLQSHLGQTVTLTTLHFLEGQSQGTTWLPRLAGFTSEQDRRFFQLFTTTKGIGMRKALRAMSLPTSQIAGAIADRDVKMLQSLPEIGRRTAETLVVALKDKVDVFVADAVSPASSESGAAGEAPGAGAGTEDQAPQVGGASGQLVRQALEVLLQLGESRLDAMRWIDQAMRLEPVPRDAQELVSRVYELRAGA